MNKTLLETAIEKNNFVLYYQTIQPTLLTDPTYNEILIRLVNDKNENILPTTFIPLAERHNLMTHIDAVVVSTLFRYLNTIGYTQEDAKTQKFTVNLSGETINRGDEFLTWVVEEFITYNIPYEAICFEITETIAIVNLKHARTMIKTLTNLGCDFAIDDFGTGYSSLMYLKELPFTMLKIDGYFVKDMLHDEINKRLVYAINDIAHIMGLKTIAEFVVTDDIMNELILMNVDYLQGYIIAMPRPLTEFKE